MEGSRPVPLSINSKGGLTPCGARGACCDAPIEARPGTQYAQAPDIKVKETKDAGTQREADSDGGLCPQNEIRTS